MKTRQSSWLDLLSLILCSVTAGTTAYLLTATFSPGLIMLLLTYLMLGKAKFGPQGPLHSLSDLKNSLVAGLIWPYLAWKKLDQELQEPSSTVYDAFVNEVHVGTIEDSVYRKIKRQAFRDPRLYVAQLANAGLVASKAIDSFVLGFPVLAFWGLIALAYLEPEAYGTVITTLQQGPSAIVAMTSRYMEIVVLTWLISLMVQAAIRGFVPGFTNVFSRAISLRLRQHLKISSEGEVTLHSHQPIAAVL